MTPPTRVALLLLTVAWGANHFVALLPLYRSTLHLTPTDLAQVFGIYAVGLLPGLLAAGPLSDRWGRRAVALPGALVALLGTAILGLGAPGFATLLVGRFVVGIGSGATFSSATAWVQDLAAGATTPGTGARRAATALSAGFGGGPFVASLVAQWLPAPLALPYAVQAAVLLAAVLGVGLMPAASAPRAALARSAAAPSGFVPRGFAREVVPVAPWVFGFPSLGFAVLPAIVRDQVGAYATLFSGVVTAVTLFSGLFVQRPLRARSAAAAGRFGLAVGLMGLLVGLAAARAASPLAVLIAASILGAGYGGCLVAGLRFVELHAAPADRGRVTGVFYVLAYLGFAAPLLFAALARRHGNTAALLTAAALAVLCLLLRLTGTRTDLKS